MKRFIALMLLLALCLSLVACGAAGTEEKKELPIATQPTEGDVPEETLYKDAMIPFEDLIPAERIVILQNAVNFGREGFYTEETKPVTEDVILDGQTVAAYKLTYALQFLTFGYENGAQLVNAAGEVLEMTKEELDAAYVYIEGFQSYTLPVVFISGTDVKVVDFDHLITDNEMVISIITEQSRRCVDMFEMLGWDTTSATYHVMATDKFFVPATPVDYDDGEIRGALSGSVNGTFPEMVPAQGKINDVLYLEKVVN